MEAAGLNISRICEDSGIGYYTWEHTAEYTYNSQGRVTAIKKTDWFNNTEDSTSKVTVTYDANGNVLSYREATHTLDENDKDTVVVWEQKFLYENGVLIRFDDSTYSMCPWLFTYDGNNQISELYLEDLDDGTHGGNYVSDHELSEWHNPWSKMVYRFSSKLENGTPSLSVWYWADYDYGVQEKTITIPSR